MNSLQAVGSTYKDFVVTKYSVLGEIQSALVELVHEPTGAKIIYIANDDPENLFCLSFQTLPYSSNGIAHILEHTVLCGSKKFPVKDPFFAMARRSLHTYMNALTGQDFTCYPASSQVEKDFYNLLDVYMDAVFHPELKKMSFLQEGHRLEFADPKKPTGDLQFQGVVYNEMKGAMSSTDSRLWKAITKHLMPDLPYAFNSGGDPKEIVNLTYDELVAFHADYYHPSRCLFFFYGNLPLKKHLDFIQPVLASKKKLAPLAPLPLQPRFTSYVSATERFPIRESESLEQKTQIAFAWLTAPIALQTDILALSLLETILTDTDASPITFALLQSGLCTHVSSSLDLEMSEIPWVILCKGTDAKNTKKLREILFDTLRTFSPSQDQIDAAIHQLEFERMEIGGEGAPFGLTLFMRAALLKQQGIEPENGLLIHSLFADLRARIKDPQYLQELLRKYLLDNPHFLSLALVPDPHMEKEEAEEEKKRLQEIKTTLTEKHKTQIREQTMALAHYQEAVEHQSLDCLPKITLKDVPTHARDFLLLQEGNVYFHDCFTNKILYADLLFDLPAMETDELAFLSFFSRILPELGTKQKSYEEMLAFQQAHIGHFDASLSLHTSQENPDVCRPSFSLRGKALYHNAKHLFDLFVEYVTSVDLDDHKRIKELLLQHATQLQNKLTKNGLNYAVQIALSGFSPASAVQEQWQGISYFQTVMRWAKNCDSAFFASLKSVGQKVLGSKYYDLVLCCDAAMFSELKGTKFYNLDSRLPKKELKKWQNTVPPHKPQNQARIIAAPVAFTALGMRTISYANPLSPFLLISTQLMENLFLHKEIREKGGAYGSGASYTPSSGNFHFYSYRDPHLARTVSMFNKAIDVITDGSFQEQELEEAKLCVLQTLDTPVQPGHRALVAYAWKRAGRSKEEREKFRNSVLKATKADIIAAVKLLQNKDTVLVSFLGQELLKKDALRNDLQVVPIEN